MIDDIKTLDRFGYLPSSLKPKSNKPVIAICESCGVERPLEYARAGKYCRPCAPKQGENREKISIGLRASWATDRLGWTHTESTKQKISSAKMGTPAWNKGQRGVFKPTAEHVEKLQAGLRIAGRTKQHRENISRALKGNTNSKGKRWVMSEEGRAACVVARSKSHKGKPAWNRGKSNTWALGEKNVAWRGGVSKRGYPSEFNAKLKLRIRQRDNFTCQLCGKTEAEERLDKNRCLAVNHIDFNKLNCAEENLNTLCHLCNIKINWEREKWTKFFQEQQRLRLVA